VSGLDEQGGRTAHISLVTSNPHPHSCHAHSHPHADPSAKGNGSSPSSDEFDDLRLFLEAHFGEVTAPKRTVENGDEDELLVMDVEVDGTKARVDLISMVRPGDPAARYET
jgi:cleavage and polyadenylation specificity factor subunit 3